MATPRADWGVAVNLFDVSQLARPRQLARFALSTSAAGSWSPALFDPHAFRFDRPTGLLAFPYVEGPWPDGFVGVVALDVDLERGWIGERGRVDHADLLTDGGCIGDWLGCDHSPLPRRSALMVGADGVAYLYTISWPGVESVRADDPGVVIGRVALAAPP